MSIRLSGIDMHNLCTDYLDNNRKGSCRGCRLSVELDKPVKERNKAFLKRIESVVLKLRKQNKD